MGTARVDRRFRRWGAALAALGIVIGVVGQVAPAAAARRPVAPGWPTSVASIDIGTRHACAVLDTGQVKCWGYNGNGQLGLGDKVKRGDGPGEMGVDLPAVDLGTGRTATSVAVGDYHSCAVLDTGQVKCWGYNNNGDLGLGDQVQRGDDPGEMGDALPAVDLGTGRTAIAVGAGVGFTCALLDNGQVKCWGFNGNGRLGLGDGANRGVLASQMGDNLPPVDLGTGRTATSLAVGDYNSCVVLDNGQVKCWGLNANGQLGIGSTADRGDGANEMGDNLPPVDLGTGRTATSVAVGDNHSCALLDTGQVKCWGYNNNGDLGLGDTARRGDGVGLMGDNLPAVDLGTGGTATAIAAGVGTTCAVLDDGGLKCWGYGGNGRLGQGDPYGRGHAAGTMGDDLAEIDLGTGRTATAVAADWSTCAVLDDGQLKCWGLNDLGQLGLGDTTDRGAAAGEMGDALPVVDLTGHPALALTAGVDATTHFTGEQVTFGLGLENTGDVDLTGVGLTGVAGLTCDPVGSTLAVGDGVHADCSRTLTSADVGTLDATFGASSDQAIADPADAPSVAVARDRAPDGEVKKAGGAFVGAGIQNADGTDQRVRVGRSRGGAVTFLARFTNAGDTPARFTVEATTSTSGLAVRYLEGQSATDVTRAVKQGTYQTARLQPGQSVTIRLAVTVKQIAQHLVEHDISVRATSTAATPQLDAVLARVHVN